nr:MAG TPA: hypothetical protein [Inoviridae sp.]
MPERQRRKRDRPAFFLSLFCQKSYFSSSPRFRCLCVNRLIVGAPLGFRLSDLHHSPFHTSAWSLGRHFSPTTC